MFVGKFGVLGQSFIKFTQSISGVIQPAHGISSTVAILINTHSFQGILANIW